MKIEKPVLNYFPDNFTPREHQVSGLQQIYEAINSGEKYIIVQAPTGSGKSFFSKTFANTTTETDSEYRRLVHGYQAYSEDFVGAFSRFKSHGAFALTTTKALQDQYKNLFGESVVFKGKSNYQCEVDESFTADVAPCVISANLKRKCWNDHICPYYEARNDALVSRFSVLNYASFFNLPDHLKRREIIVCDECSELEDEIVKNYSVLISYKQLTYLGVQVEKLTTENSSKVVGWLGDCFSAIKDTIDSFNERSRFEKNKIELIKQQQRKELAEAISHTINHWNDAQYIVEKDAEKVSITPFKIDKLSSCLFNFADVVILMSATIVDKDIFAKNLGIPHYKYIEIPSTFDPKKSPIYCHNKYPLNYKTIDTNLPKIINLIEQIAENHKGEKGIIHTHSFAITQAVQNRLGSKRFLYREEGTNNESIIREHTLRTDDTVLVSPSLTMGLDLKGDLGKWQIIVKLPYPSLANKRVKMLFDKDPDWYKMKMFVTLIQAAGRCTRTKEDESVTYILDGLSGKTIVQNKDILPGHFLARVV
jgi:Rad3-related DNA helicase